MESVFVNFTNHPSELWEEKQLKEAEKYGRIVDLPFPNVDPQGDEKYIAGLAGESVDRILQLRPSGVLCQGEFTLAYQVITKLKERQIPVLAACSQRNVKTDGLKKEVTFSFERFRRY